MPGACKAEGEHVLPIMSKIIRLDDMMNVNKYRMWAPDGKFVSHLKNEIFEIRT